ncbi:hypothetical protein [Algivirga pacifica]|uniref:SH3b domain-containing protein n=1 Tax=Algivirga pacifica TaxID=1162670 RepID=A0ABP9CX96_9BACT
MQKKLKFFVLLITYSLIINTSFSQEKVQLLSEADSLFESGSYTKSLNLYKRLIKQEGAYTPKMLLNMAFITQAEGAYAEALYYLNLYYKHTSDRSVLEKMETLAQDNNLSGYTFTDYEYFSNVFHKYKLVFFSIGALLILVTLGLSIYKKQRKENALIPFIFLILFSIGNLWLFNLGFQRTYGIVQTVNLYGTDSPSAGGKRIQKLQEGDRILLGNTKDIWYKAEVDEQFFYVRKNNLLIVNGE